MKLGVIADDFTGASDIALAIAEAGFSVAQFIGIPDGGADPGLDAGVVSLKTRTAPVAEAVAQSLAACDWLVSQGVGQIVFKICSTFDSTPEGNIGPVLDALADRLGTDRSIICPAYPENGRSLYLGHLFVGDVLLSESGMRNHPLTPMTDPDIRRVLAPQTTRPVAHVPAPTVFRGAEAIRSALTPGHNLVDAIRDEDLHQIARAARGLPLLCGGSGIAIGLPANWGASATPPDWNPMPGPGVVLSGSCSEATRAQVAAFAARAPSREVTAAEAVEARVTAKELADWVMAQGQAPLVYSSAAPNIVAAAQARYGQDRAAAALESLFGELAARLVARGVTRIVVAGGETSGGVVNALGITGFEIGPRLAAGVPALKIMGAQPIVMALKSGNFGGPGFFGEALAILGGEA